MQIPLKGKRCTKTLMFSLQYEDITWLWLHCDVVVLLTEEIKGSLHALSHDILLNIAS